MKGIGAGIGLIGLLMGVGIMFYLTFGGPGNPGTVRPALEAKRETQEMVNAVSGRDANSVPVTESITFELEPKGVRVKTVDPQGALAKQFGLQPGDLITEIGPLPASQFATSISDATAFMQAQYARPDPWTVVRGTQRIKLPDERNVGLETAPPPQPTAQQPEAPANPPANEPRTNPRNQAMDLMKKIESH